MGDLLDLILDFERRLIHLLKDLICQPHRVAQSIVQRNKDYVGAFKFYSLAASLWVLAFQFGNKYLQFFDEEFTLPLQWENFMRAQQNFIFLMVPFIGLLTVLLPIATINWFFFRKYVMKWFDHVNFSMYIGGLFLLYALPFFFSLYTLGTIVVVDATILNLVAYVLLIGSPLIYIGWAYAKIVEGRPAIAFMKSCAIVILICWLSVNYILELPWVEMLHRNLFYATSPGLETFSGSVEINSNYLKNRLVQEKNDTNQFIDHTIQTEINSFFEVVQTTYDRSNFTFTNRIVVGNGDVYELSKVFTKEEPFKFSIHQLDSVSTFAVAGRHRFYSDTTWLITRKGVQVKESQFNNFFSLRSQFANWGGEVLASGISFEKNRPMLAIVKESELENIIELNKNGYVVDQLKIAADSSAEMMLSQNSKSGRLSGIQWVKGQYKVDQFQESGSISIFKNEFTPTKNLWMNYLHRPKLRIVNDSTSVVAFQIMTDSSFAFNISQIDTRKSMIRWNKIITLPVDFIQFDNLLIDETSNSVYLLGRWLHVQTGGFNLHYRQYPFLEVLDLITGKFKGRFTLKSASKFPILISSIEETYTQFTSSYQTAESIYFTYDGFEYFKIPKGLNLTINQ